MAKISKNENAKTWVKKISKLRFGGGSSSLQTQAMFDKINEIIDSVRKQEGHRGDKTGKEGEIKVKRLGGYQYKLKVKTDRGWAFVNLTLEEE